MAGEELSRRVGKRIALLRRSRPQGLLSQERLAERARMKVGTLRKIERGERSATLSRLADICRALGVSLHDLVCGTKGCSDAEEAVAPFVRFVRKNRVKKGQTEVLAGLLEKSWTSFLDSK